MVTLENYEEYIMMQADGELSPAEEQALAAFLEQYPELKAEQAAYALTHLAPDETITFTGKQSLIKKLPAKRIAFPVWGRYSIAAGVALLIFVSVTKWVATDNNVNTGKVAVIVTPTPAAVYLQKNIATAVAGTTVAAAKAPILAPVTEPRTVKNNSNINTNSSIAAHNIKKEHRLDPRPDAMQNHQEVLEIAALPTLAVEKIKVQNIGSTEMALLTIPQDQPEVTVKKRRHLLDRLPIDEANKQQIRSITAAVASAYEKVNDAKEKLDNNGLTIQIPQANISLNF